MFCIVGNIQTDQQHKTFIYTTCAYTKWKNNKQITHIMDKRLFIDAVSIKDCTASNYRVTSGLETGTEVQRISHDLIMILSLCLLQRYDKKHNGCTLTNSLPWKRSTLRVLLRFSDWWAVVGMTTNLRVSYAVCKFQTICTYIRILFHVVAYIL